jgi:flagellar basal-body rod protein FlgG
MIRGINTIQRSFNVLSERQKTMANNAANVTTPGYRAQQLTQSTLENRPIHNYMDGPQLNRRAETDEWTFGNQLDAAYRQFNNGSIQGTGMDTDLALQGNGFFTVTHVETGEILYTRNGNFTVNEAGQLTTQEGHIVQGIPQGGGMQPVIVGQGNASQFSVDAQGFVTIPGQDVPQFLYITQFENPDGLVAVGDTLFQGDGGEPTGAGYSITQGFIEQSNANMADIMTDMLQIAREFEANQRALHATDETLSRATSEVGRV